jgi:hypothetical protein
MVSLELRIARRAFLLRSTDHRFRGVAKGTFSRDFLRSPPSDSADPRGWTIHLSLTELHPVTGTFPVSVQSTSGGWVELGNEASFFGRFNFRERIGEFTLFGSDQLTPAGRTLWSLKLSSLMRIFLSLVAAREGGVLFHGSTMGPTKCGAVTCCALSGGGKSTLAGFALARGWSLLADEVSIVTSLPQKETLVHPSPFFSDRAKQSVLSIEHEPPLRAICLLEKSSEDKLTRIENAAEAIPELLRHTFGFVGTVEEHGLMVDLISDLIARIPVYRFHFRKSIDCLEVLKQVV